MLAPRVLLAIALALSVTPTLGCRTTRASEAADVVDSDYEGAPLPVELSKARDAADLCPERAACKEAVGDWIARCEDAKPEDDDGEVGEACFVAGFMSRIVAGPAYQGDAAGLAAQLLAMHDRACQRGHADGCAWASSLRLFSGDDLDKAIRDAETGCAAGSGAACSMLGRALLRDEATRERGEATLVEMCARDFGQACGDLAHLYRAGTYLRESINDAVNYAERGCALEDGSSCAAFAALVYNFESLADLGPKALDAAGFACERGHATSCATASVLYDLHRDDPSVEGWDDDRMIATLDWGCTELEGPSACVLLGILHESGLGESLPANYQRAAELHQWACEHGDDEGCLRFGVVLSNSSDQNQAEFGRRLVVELCKEGYGPACVLLPPEMR